MKDLFLNLGTQEMILLLPMLLTAVLYVHCLVHCIRNPRLAGNTKLLWLIVILVAPFIGSLLYLIWGKRGKEQASI